MQEIVDRLMADDRGAQIARTLIHPYLNHAATMFQSGYATGEDIDAAMRFGCGYPIGPLALIDALGPAQVVAALEEQHAVTGDDLHRPAEVLNELAGASSTFATANDRGTPVTAPQFRRTITAIGVVGTGTMAAGIVEVFAKAGYDVTYVGRGDAQVTGVRTAIATSLDKAIARDRLDEDGKADVLGRLTGATEREALGGVDIVVEAIAEDLGVKEQLFGDLDRIAKPGAILATTTSSLSIDALAARTARSHDVVGMHFFNPAPIMKLVEVVSGAATSQEVAETVRALCLSIGKHPVSCTDRAGFIVNALLFPYLNDAIRLHEAGEATIAQIDTAMREAKLPMGPFELLDVVGTDVSLAIQQSLVDAFGHAGWKPARILEELVEQGRMGRKARAGFHTY